MCGIIFIVDKNGIDKKKALNSLKFLKKRGPDYEHYDIIDNIFIGQTTLEISGKYHRDNFISKSKKFIISFNGEIYNSNLKNDTKYLVDLFDKMPFKNIINTLDGMYCFSVFNHEKNELFLARDMIGEKNMYYYQNSDLLIISSEILPIVLYLNQLDIDWDEIKNYYLTRHFLMFDRTIVKNIKCFLPGEHMIYDISTLKTKYHNIKNITSLITKKKQDELSSKTDSELNKILNNLFDSVCQDMIPSVKFGCIISGGIDSSLSTALISKQKKPDLCVCCYCDNKDYVATKNMKIFEKSLNRPIEVININEKMWANNIVECQMAFLSPIITHSAVNYSIMSKYVSDKNIKVLFSGDGADELFGGYDCYLSNSQEYSLYCPSNYSKLYDLKIKFLKNINNKLNKNLSDTWEYSKKFYKNISDSSLLCDSLTMLPDIGCRTTDTMGSMHGIEIRNIYYRKKILEFILNCPINKKIDFEKKITKKLLKSAYLNFFDKSTIIKKQGFTGYPNESFNLVDITFPHTTTMLEIVDYDKNDRDLMWKMINTEIFLEYTIKKIKTKIKF